VATSPFPIANAQIKGCDFMKPSGSRLSLAATCLSLSLIACGGSSSNDSTNNGGSSGSNKGGAGGSNKGDAAGGGKGGTAGASNVSTGGTGGTASGGAGGTATGGMGGTAAGGQGGAATSATVAFTANFEDGVVGQGPPAPFSGSQVAKVDTEHAFSGTKSMKVVAAGGQSAMFGLNPKGFIAANKKTAYVRYMVWLDNLPGKNATDSGHWDLSKMNGMFKGGGFNVNGYLSFGGMGGDNQKLHMFGDDINKKGRQDCVKPSPFVMALKKWTCIEMKIDENDVLNYGLKIDDEELQSYSFPFDAAAANCVPDWNIFDGVWYVPEVTVIQFGFAHIHEQPNPVTVWFDDIAVDSKPIGCPKK
jgi:hypothetical protein